MALYVLIFFFSQEEVRNKLFSEILSGFDSLI